MLTEAPWFSWSLRIDPTRFEESKEMRGNFKFLVVWSFITHANCQADDFGANLGEGFVFAPIVGAVSQEFSSFVIEGGISRIQAPVSPLPTPPGPAWAALYRDDVNDSGEFSLSVDLSFPGPAIVQAVGFYIILQCDPGDGDGDGYSVSHQFGIGDVVIDPITDEVPTGLAFVDVDTSGVSDVRLKVNFDQGDFEVMLFEAEDLLEPLAFATAFDTPHKSGYHGLFLFADRDDG